MHYGESRSRLARMELRRNGHVVLNRAHSVAAIVAMGFLVAVSTAYAVKYLPLPNGSTFEVPDDITYQEAICNAQMQTPESFAGYPPPINGSCIPSVFAMKEFARIKAGHRRPTPVQGTGIILPNGEWYPWGVGDFDVVWCKAYQERPDAFLSSAQSMLTLYGCEAGSAFDRPLAVFKDFFSKNPRLERIAEKGIGGGLAGLFIAGVVFLFIGLWAVLARLRGRGDKGRSRAPSQIGENVMTTSQQRRWGIFTFSVLMALLTLVGGQKGSPYVAFWGYIAYLAYKGDIEKIALWLKVVIGINAIAMVGIAVFMDGAVLPLGESAKSLFLVAVGITLTIKLLLYAYVASLCGRVSSSNVSDAVYAAVLKELDGAGRQDGAWARALAEADGDESKAKARYIQYRVQQIKAEAKALAFIKENWC